MTRRSGLTLLELLVASIIGVIVVAGSGFAYQTAIKTQSRYTSRVERQAHITALLDRLTNLLQGAVLPTDAANPAGYFILNALTGSTSGQGQRLVFTAGGPSLRWDALRSQDDFETQNTKFGPQGGLLEVELGTETIGDSTPRDGLLIRTQRPADGDPTQGGEQEVLADEVSDLSFEFWDGTSWITEWDTQTQQTKRLPAAVRVRFQLTDETDPRLLVVRIPASDVTIDDPLTTDGGTQQ
jgi:type II secretory pathway component PulJ